MATTTSPTTPGVDSVETSVLDHRAPRVLLVTEAAGAGVGRHFLDLACGLADQGVDVHGVYSPGRLDEQFAGRLATGDYPPMTSLPMQRSVGWHDLAAARQLRRWMQANGPFDLVHAHSSKAGAICRWALWRHRVPVVYTPHAFVTLDPNLGNAKRLVFGSAERFLAWRPRQRIIAVGHREAEHAVRLGIARDKVRVVINGVDLASGSAREQLRHLWQVPEDALVIGFVGRFSPQKAPLRLVEIMQSLAPKHPRLHLAIVGSGPLEAEMRERFTAAGVESRVRWLGAVDGAQQMPGFDILCQTSLYEGMSYVILEAVQAGLPIVATDAGDTSAVVEPGENGELAAVDDCPGLINGLDRLLSHEHLRAQYMARSRQRRDEFSLQKMVRETLRVYAELEPRFAGG